MLNSKQRLVSCETKQIICLAYISFYFNVDFSNLRSQEPRPGSVPLTLELNIGDNKV